MFDTLKRKNDDKPKGLPRPKAVMVGLFIAFALTVIGVGWRVLSLSQCRAAHRPDFLLPR